jgi:16S rRNA (cytidine1402-2'-O)-methyltransferase
MPGILYVVATPIGNLEDVTLRALRILGEVTVIAAEDTRRTAKLLQHYSISTPTTSLHQHNERRRVPALLSRLQGGESIALVSDAGTPVLSDPGQALVAAAHEAGVRVEPIPGPSAAIAALSASGFPGDQYTFVGFPPSRANARAEWLRSLSSETRTIVMYEAPHRIVATLTDALGILGDRPTALGRELTKAHEDLVVRPISAHLEMMAPARGEYTLVIQGAAAVSIVGQTPDSAESLRTEFKSLTETRGMSPRGAAKELGKKYNMPTRDVYALATRGENSGQ